MDYYNFYDYNYDYSYNESPEISSSYPRPRWRKQKFTNYAQLQGTRPADQKQRVWMRRIAPYLEAPIQAPSLSYGDIGQLNLLQPPPQLQSISSRLGLDNLIQIDFLTFILLLGAIGAAASFVLFRAIVDNGKRNLVN